jgi:hypothetical protein
VPDEVRIGNVPVGEYSLMHDVPDACFDRGVDQGLALGQHGNGLTRQKVDPVHAVQRVGEGSRVVEVEERRVPSC